MFQLVENGEGFDGIFLNKVYPEVSAFPDEARSCLTSVHLPSLNLIMLQFPKLICYTYIIKETVSIIES